MPLCPNGIGGCGTLVRMENGVVVEVEGDPSNPINRGKLCSKAGASSIEQLYHPDRLDYPLIRVGKRGLEAGLDHLCAAAAAGI